MYHCGCHGNLVVRSVRWSVFSALGVIISAFRDISSVNCEGIMLVCGKKGGDN